MKLKIRNSKIEEDRIENKRKKSLRCLVLGLSVAHCHHRMEPHLFPIFVFFIFPAVAKHQPDISSHNCVSAHETELSAWVGIYLMTESNWGTAITSHEESFSSLFPSTIRGRC